MALPGNVPSTEYHAGNYIEPYGRPRSLLEDYEEGGIAINDGTQGLQVQIWHLTYDEDTGDFTVTPELYGSPVVVLNVPDVVECSLAFDQNMHVFIAYVLKDCTAKYYWYDTLLADHTTTTLPAGSRSPYATLDDHRALQTGSSDIILGYIYSGNCYYRQQRDRYDTDRTIATDVGAARLWRIGMTDILRLHFDIREGRGVRLAHIVGDLALAVGFPAQHLDVGALYETIVRGFRVAGAYSSADAIRSLQKTYPFDLPEPDGTLLAVNRGGPAVANIPQSDMVVGKEAHLETAREQGVEFPAKMHIAIAHAETDYKSTKQTSERRSPSDLVVGEVTVDTAVNFETDEAAQVADKLHKIAWAELEGRAKFAVPESYAYLVPSDIVNVEVRAGTYKRMRIVRAPMVDGVIEIEAVMDRASAYGSTVTGVAPPDATPPPATIGSPTEWEYMELPALGADQDTLHYYVAAKGETEVWFGTQLQRQVGTDFEIEADIVEVSTMGEVQAAVGTASADYTDTANSILVTLNDVPEGITDELMRLGRNLALIGDELIQFRDVTAEGAAWRLSHLFRGRKNTTPSAHSAGERFVLLDNPARVVTDVALLNQSMTLRAVSYGTDSSDATQTAHTFTGKSQREWAPYGLIASQSGSDWVLSWVPRWRLGNSATPVRSSYFLAWRLKITSGGTTVLKETTDENYTYTAAEQTADFGSTLSTFDIQIVGLNNLTGEGDALSETV